MPYQEILYFIVTLLLLTICLFLADKLIGNKPDNMGGGYFVKALLTALVIIILIIAVGIVLGIFEGLLGIQQIATILGFVLASYAVKILLLERENFERAVWVTLVAYLFVYIIDWISVTLGGPQLIQYI